MKIYTKFLLILVVVNSSCIANALTIDIVYSSNNCTYEEETITLIDQEQLNTIVSYGNRMIIPPISTPIIDNVNKNIVLVAMGKNTSFSNTITITDNNIEIVGDKAILPIKFIKPVTKITAQAINSPCIVAQIEKGYYTSVDIIR